MPEFFIFIVVSTFLLYILINNNYDQEALIENQTVFFYSYFYDFNGMFS